MFLFFTFSYLEIVAAQFQMRSLSEIWSKNGRAFLAAVFIQASMCVERRQVLINEA
jgi:hypothetical protein